MKYPILIFLGVIGLFACTFSADYSVPRVIFDTDIGPSYDDIGALTMLHALENREEAKILATIASNNHEDVAAVLSLLNTYWGEPDLPIGVPGNKAVTLKDMDGWTHELLNTYPHSISRNMQAYDAVQLYRRTLSIQPDTSVTIITAGFLTNLAALLGSGADRYSPLSGVDLVKKKVRLLVSMAGEFPTGKEYNIYKDIGSSMTVAKNWPTSIIFTGFEVGDKIRTGLPLIQNDSVINNPTKDAYKIGMKNNPDETKGLQSWDQTAVLLAVRGATPYFTLEHGRINIQTDGSNTWDKSGVGHRYAILDTSPEVVGKVIDDLMMEVPEK